MRYWFTLLLTLLVSMPASGKTYHWQDVSFEYDGQHWLLLTDRTVNGVRLLHLRYLSEDGYPLNLFLGIVPKTLKGARQFAVQHARSANAIAADFSWPVVKRFAKARSRQQTLTSFNQVLVANKLAAGALLMVPTPKESIFISAQSFYLDDERYYLLGSVISRIDKGAMRTIGSYAQRLQQAYLLLNAIEFKAN